MALVLIGFMGAGKSTLAARLAERRGREAIDSDVLLTERFGHSVAREFELHGEQAFRTAEEQVVCERLATAHPRDVIAVGGGSVLSARIRDALAAHTAALIDVEADVAWDRVRDRGSERPLARDREAFIALYAQRRPLYEQIADTRLAWSESPSGEYPVFVGGGLLDGARLDAVWPFDLASSRSFYMTDDNVEELYEERLAEPAWLLTIPSGEKAKTLATAEYVWEKLTRAGMTRADHLVALGGGVVGDLAGFCAATYQRGVPVVQIPTTLVAQVDSAYGGKTGVDLPEAKNYVGAYHQPAAVLADPHALRTLPAAELSAGWVEVLKTALIAGGELWERVAQEAPGAIPDASTIFDCVRMKLAVVAEDERDGGRRQVLNLGHTVGHAIETASGYTRYRHGEAVGLGLLAALRLSGQPELRAQVRELLHARGLPVTLASAGAAAGPGGGREAREERGPVREEQPRGERRPRVAGSVGVESILAAIAHDKKRVGAHTPFVLVNAPGDVRVGCEVAEHDLRAAVAELA